jgi:hypothetical protein
MMPGAEPSPPVIALLTDFGCCDEYVGVMKGVILTICRNAVLVDISHEIPPQDIRRGAFLLWAAVSYFPPGTVFLAVVDPGVGTGRDAVAVTADGRRFVTPDNGVLTMVLAGAEAPEAIRLTSAAHRLPTISRTFHGRDIFAPAAAHLATGVPMNALGPPAPVSSLSRLPVSSPRETGDGGLVGEVIFADHFGNLATNIRRAHYAAFRASRGNTGEPVIEIGDQQIVGIAGTYGEVPPGTLLALFGSRGVLEISASRSDAAEKTDAAPGDPVIIRLP